MILDLQYEREAKLASGMKEVLDIAAMNGGGAAAVSVAEVTHLGASEANFLREGFMKAFNVFQELTEASNTASSRESASSASGSSASAAARGGRSSGGGGYLTSPDRRDVAAYAEASADADADDGARVRSLVQRRMRQRAARDRAAREDAGEEAQPARDGGDAAPAADAFGDDPDAAAIAAAAAEGGEDELGADAPASKLRKHR